MLLCSGLFIRIAFPNDEVLRVEQPGFQPQTVANIALDSRYPHSIFCHNNEVCILRKKDNINRA